MYVQIVLNIVSDYAQSSSLKTEVTHAQLRISFDPFGGVVTSI
jgi:hypothetical protein